MSVSCDIAITGLGLVTPLGVGPESFWKELEAGTSAVGIRQDLVSERWPIYLGARVRDFDPRPFIQPRKALKVMCPPIQFGCAAAVQAVRQAGVDAGVVQPDRFSALFGTEQIFADPYEIASVFRKCFVNRVYDHDKWAQHAMHDIEPLWMLKYLPNMVASHISIAHDARGPNNTICQSEASSLLALVESIDLLERGKVDAVICGGTGSPLTVTAMVYRGAWKLSQRVDQPATALRPFDVSRDGMVMGEGAGAFLLERASDARRRGASILARLVSYARGFCLPTDGRFVKCLTEMLRGASRAAGWAAHDVGHVNAHGASTQDDDAREAQAISAALNNVPVIAPKANVGNLGSGAGAVELAASVLALRHRRLPPVANTSVVDPQCPVNVVRAVTPLEQPTGLKLNFTDHGQIVVVGLAAAE